MTCERKCSNDFSKLPSKTKDDLLRDYANAIQDIARVVENCSESPDMYLILKVCERIKEFELFVFSDRSNSEFNPESVETVEFDIEKVVSDANGLFGKNSSAYASQDIPKAIFGFRHNGVDIDYGMPMANIEHPEGL